MQKLNKFFCLLLIVCVSFTSKAQNKQFPWMLNFGFSAPQFTIGDQKFYKEYFNVKNWNAAPSFNLKASRHIIGGLSVQPTFSIGSANRFPQTSARQWLFIDGDINLKYSFANGYILKEKCWFDPYVVVGGGINWYEDPASATKSRLRGDVEAGLGFNIWLMKNVALFMQASYNFIPTKHSNPLTNDARPSYMHHTFGLATRFGKGLDTDKDGVPDAEDKCPTVPGKAELNGCPDTDGDGITDADDKCPSVAGLATFAGCPDTDGDGIEDSQDECPTVAGTKENRGCPDTDGDGILDKDDACPTIKGIAATKGCPDSDGDGIADAQDKCPTIKGIAALQGCPDSDGDGVGDADDKCPNQYGVASNFGCPAPAATPTITEEVKKEVQQKLSFAAKNIEFETGSDVIRKSSYDDLDNVVSIMNQYPSILVNIDGHTDNVGKEQANVDLSMRRATAVYNYLSKKGIGSSRMIPSGFGPYKPIATNNTAEGKQRNRRVELNLK